MILLLDIQIGTVMAKLLILPNKRLHEIFPAYFSVLILY